MRTSLALAVTLVATLVRLGAAVPVTSGSNFAAKAKAGLRLLSLEEGAEPVWKTEEETLEIMRAGKNFVGAFMSLLRQRLTTS
jgi:leucyl aminopeptidase